MIERAPVNRRQPGGLRLALALLVAALAAGAQPVFSAPAPLSAAELDRAERRLAELGYWTGPLDGRLDAVSRRGLLAFQKVAGRPTTGRLTRDELRALQAAPPPSPRETTGPHVEIDLERQILFLVDEAGRAHNVVTISSGSGRPFHHPRWGRGDAVTPCGRFSVYRKLAGWHQSPLGAMHNPMFVVGGIAIHGSADVPLRPASHGCIRIPMFASQVLTRWVGLETPVLVYGCAEEGRGSGSVAGGG